MKFITFLRNEEQQHNLIRLLAHVQKQMAFPFVEVSLWRCVCALSEMKLCPASHKQLQLKLSQQRIFWERKGTWSLTLMMLLEEQKLSRMSRCMRPRHTPPTLTRLFPGNTKFQQKAANKHICFEFPGGCFYCYRYWTLNRRQSLTLGLK